jgi:hypothetical protein
MRVNVLMGPAPPRDPVADIDPERTLLGRGAGINAGAADAM